MRYLVGLLTGGLMEQPKFELEEPFQIIIANSEKEAGSQNFMSQDGLI